MVHFVVYYGFAPNAVASKPWLFCCLYGLTKKKKSLLNHCYCGKTNINFVLYHGFTTKIII